MAVSDGKDTFIVCRNSQGIEVRATLLRLTRFIVVFEVYNPYSILQLSEVLSDFKIVMNDRMVYSGRAIVSNLVNTGIMLMCEASLEDSWLDVDFFSPLNREGNIESEFVDFLKEWGKVQLVAPEFKVVIADIQTLLTDLRRWLEQVEFGIRSNPSEDRAKMEKDVVDKLKKPMLPMVTDLFGKFEHLASLLTEEQQPIYRAYGRRLLHPLVLCAPFVFRTFQKPLGYAGDYEMVNMILRDPYEGASLFAKVVNYYFWNQAPAEAHRNRVHKLADCLAAETQRVTSQGRVAKIFNLGCGPAKEVQEFLSGYDICEKADFTLLDFNDETLAFTQRELESLKIRHRRRTPIQLVKRSVNQILKETFKASSDGPLAQKYDLVYCAGLFDYLSDRICQRLVNIFYEMLLPGGMLLATNVSSTNPARQLMEYFMEWHLVYRNVDQVKSLAPEAACPDLVRVQSDSTGVNLFLEVRKPENG